LVLGIGITGGQYYWILSALHGIVLTIPFGAIEVGMKSVVSCFSAVFGQFPGKNFSELEKDSLKT